MGSVSDGHRKYMEKSTDVLNDIETSNAAYDNLYLCRKLKLKI